MKDVFELDENEQIFYEFSCSLSQTVNLPGRLYVTERFLCFSADVLGIEAKKKVEIEKIKKLYKDTSLLFFDSSIVIELEKNSGYDFSKLSFTSFKNRDEVLECITSIW